jgi:hypothetical protein
MVDDVRPRGGPADSPGVEQVADDQFNAEAAQEGEVAGGADESPHVFAAADELLGDMTAEQPGRAGDHVVCCGHPRRSC